MKLVKNADMNIKMEFHFDIVRIPVIVKAHLKAWLSTELNIGLLSRPAASILLQCTMLIIINSTNFNIIMSIIVVVVILDIVIITIMAIITNIIVIVIITITMYGIDQSIDHLIYEAPTNKHAPNHTLVQSL